jgi:hypothetical protein
MRLAMRIQLMCLTVGIVALSLLVLTPADAMRGGEDATGDSLVLPIGRCSGALIHPRIVATAFHCRWFQFEIAYAPGSLRGGNATSSMGVATFSPTTPWDPAYPRHDIALVVLSEPLPFNSKVRIATRPEIEEWMGNQSPGLIYGYGITYEGDVYNKKPHRSNWYPLDVYWEEKYIVTESRTAATATCAGDSGGPTYFQKDGSILYVGPTASTNIPKCADINWPFGPRNSSPILALYPELIEQALAKVAELEAAEAKVKEEEAQKAKVEAVKKPKKKGKKAKR